MTKRLVTFLLSICMMLSLCTVAYSKDEVSPVDTNKAEFLNYLGIFQTMEENEYSSYMTREDFAYSTAKFMCLNASTAKRYYNDLRAEGYAFGYINALAEAGILSPSADDSFRPFDNITYNEAYKMIISALGYTSIAEARGGYPFGYNRIAGTLGFNIKNGDENVSFAEACELFFDALKSYPYDITNIKGDGTLSFASADEYYAEKIFNLKYLEGTIITNNYGSIKEDSVSEEGRININNVCYDIDDDINNESLPGTYGEFFVTDEARPQVIYIGKTVQKDELSIDIDDFVEFDNGQISYYKNPDGTKVSTENTENTVIVYNGLPLRSKIRETFANLNKGKITLKDSDNNGKYDIVDIRDYKNFYVKFIDGGKLYNDLSSGEYFDTDNTKSLIIEKSGIKASLKDISSEISLSIAASTDKSIAKIIINDSLTGSLTNIDEKEIGIDNQRYTVEKSYLKDFNLTLGEKYTFYIDLNGDVAYAKKSTDKRMTLAYLIDISNTNDAFDEGVKIKLVNASGEKAVYEINDKIKIDAVTYKNKKAEDIINVLKNGKSHARQLIQYELNSDGKIIDIDTIVKNPGEDPEYSLTKVFTEVKNRWYHLGRYGFSAICNSETAAFCIPDDGSTDQDKYFVQAGAASLTNSSDCYATLDCYYTGENSAYVDAVIGEKNVDTYDPKTVIMFDEAHETLNSDGECIYKIFGYKQGLRSEYTIERDVTGADKINEFHRGDLLVFKENQINEVSVISKVFDALTKKPIDWGYETDKELLYVDGFKEHYCEELNLSFGYVRKNYDGQIISIGKNATCEISERIYANKNNMLYNADTDKIELISGNAIVDYETAGENCMRAVHHMWYEDFRGLYLYN